ncbi:hypothetical protein HC928_20850 [bacterium]|nr:hypothetical protein [bacterium]
MVQEQHGTMARRNWNPWVGLSLLVGIAYILITYPVFHFFFFPPTERYWNSFHWMSSFIDISQLGFWFNLSELPGYFIVMMAFYVVIAFGKWRFLLVLTVATLLVIYTAKDPFFYERVLGIDLIPEVPPDVKGTLVHPCSTPIQVWTDPTSCKHESPTFSGAIYDFPFWLVSLFSSS